ncbi:MAG TPA: hypothetical protein VKV28_01215 [Candidatus Binataceae bacterium]|nr:hypothetical protein [Candidatus Binataceae bacterium]
MLLGVALFGLLALGAIIASQLLQPRRTAAVAAARDANILEGAHSVRPHLSNAAAGPAMSDLFLLPKVDQGFAGSWGGHVQIQAATSQMSYAQSSDVAMSYYFGERNGVVFLKTNVYGDPQWPVVKTAVKVIDPKTIEFRLDSLCRSCTPEVRQQEVTRLTLIDHQHMRAHCYTYAYSVGDGHAQLNYEGILHLLTPAELAAIDREVQRGNSLLSTINSKTALPNS